MLCICIIQRSLHTYVLLPVGVKTGKKREEKTMADVKVKLPPVLTLRRKQKFRFLACKKVTAIRMKVPDICRKVLVNRRKVPAICKKVPAIFRKVSPGFRKATAICREIPAIFRNVSVIRRKVPVICKKFAAIFRKVSAFFRKVSANPMRTISHWIASKKKGMEVFCIRSGLLENKGNRTRYVSAPPIKYFHEFHIYLYMQVSILPLPPPSRDN
jgi:hypothetical protein